MLINLLAVNPFLDNLLKVLSLVGLMTISAMSLIYLERKIAARFHMRLGPTRTGPAGLLQSVADALKLLGKEDIRPKSADPWSFELAPYFVFIPAFMMLVTVPFTLLLNVQMFTLGLLYLIAISSVSIVGWVMAGWGSDNRYALIGALRAAAQGISYELPLVLAVLCIAMLSQSLNLNVIIESQSTLPNILFQPFPLFLFFTAALAEMNRSPFDIPVGESEVVGGPFVEYSGIRWSMFFLAEYTTLLVMSILIVALFLGGWAWPFGENLGTFWQIMLTLLKTSFVIFIIFWTRVSIPRMRIDQLMNFCWKVLIPLAFLQIFFNGFILVLELPKILLSISSIGLLALLVVIVNKSIQNLNKEIVS
jgi:NADH-quinone oxidoreductase subunit H